jgi:hypothetical protein
MLIFLKIDPYAAFDNKEEEVDKIVTLITKQCLKYGIDGIVVDN